MATLGRLILYKTIWALVFPGYEIHLMDFHPRTPLTTDIQPTPAKSNLETHFVWNCLFVGILWAVKRVGEETEASHTLRNWGSEEGDSTKEKKSFGKKLLKKRFPKYCFLNSIWEILALPGCGPECRRKTSEDQFTFSKMQSMWRWKWK